MTIFEKYVVADADDAWTKAGVAQDSDTFVYLNRGTAEKVYGGFRFQSVTIPKNVVINVAWCSFKFHNVGAKTRNTYIHCEDIASATAIEGGTLLDNRNLTTANVHWTGTGTGIIQTPSLVDLIQEVVDRADWASGNHIAVIFDDQQSTQYAMVTDRQGEPDTSLLHIEYDVVPTIQTTDNLPNSIRQQHADYETQLTQADRQHYDTSKGKL